MIVNAHPALPEFEYLRPETPAEASEFLARHPGAAHPFLGGTDVFVRMRDGHLAPRFLMDVKNLKAMGDLRWDPVWGLTLGAAVNMNRVSASPEIQAHYPLLAEACRSVGSHQLRTRATIVGNLCNASPAGDTIGACLAFKGILQIHGTGGPRQEPLAAFFLGPGRTTLQAGDIVMALHLPLPPAHSRGVYLKLGRNKLSDLSIVGVTVLGYPDADAHSGFRFRLALASVAPVPLVPAEAEAYLAEHLPTPSTLREAARLAADACAPIDDVRGSALYRKQMVMNLTHRALAKLWGQLKN